MLKPTLSVSLFLFVSMLSASALADSVTDLAREAYRHLSAGRANQSEQELRAAASLYRELRTKRNDKRDRYNEAICYAELRQPQDVLRTVREFRKFELTVEEETDAKKLVADAEALVGRLDITSTRPIQSMSVNDTLIAFEPSEPVYVAPGEHRINVTFASGGVAHRSVRVEQGRRAVLEFAESATPATSTASTNPPAVVLPPHSKTSTRWSTGKKVTVIAGASVTGALAITAIASAVVALGQKGDARDDSRSRDEREGAADSFTTWRTVSTVTAWSALGAGALTGVAWAFWPKETVKEVGARWSPVIGMGHAGVIVHY